LLEDWLRTIAPLPTEENTLNAMEVRLLTPADSDAVLAASSLFDAPADPEIAQRFLDSPGHYLFIAYEQEQPVGFVSGVEMTHPDKGTEMFLYELAVDEAFQHRGIATALVTALDDLAREHGCYGMWVLTDADNTAARATYRTTRATTESDQLMFTWDWKT
jgi:ribosomal protein S18 acetylase RimI-like enzyme